MPDGQQHTHYMDESDMDESGAAAVGAAAG